MGVSNWLRRLWRRPSRPAPASGRVDQVAHWLFVGPALTVDGYRRLAGCGVTHVIDLRQEGVDDARALAAIGVRWRHVPVADRAAPSDGQLDEVIRWLDTDADPRSEQAVYIHCQAGQGRTPTLAVALLMHHGLPLSEAYRRVAAARPETNPTPVQERWLQEVESRLRDRSA